MSAMLGKSGVIQAGVIPVLWHRCSRTIPSPTGCPSRALANYLRITRSRWSSWCAALDTLVRYDADKAVVLKVHQNPARRPGMTATSGHFKTRLKLEILPASEHLASPTQEPPGDRFECTFRENRQPMWAMLGCDQDCASLHW